MIFVFLYKNISSLQDIKILDPSVCYLCRNNYSVIIIHFSACFMKNQEGDQNMIFQKLMTSKNKNMIV